MSRLTDLLGQLKKSNVGLASELEKEFKILSSRREFGLNFERHKPEVVDLPLRKIRKGDKVRILPERGKGERTDDNLWVVKRIVKNKNKSKAMLNPIAENPNESKEETVENLVVVAEFRDSIYPGLVSTGKVKNGGKKPYHTVINGENYHAIKALTFTHKSKIDVIYIDPPYNTGTKDWKYNNDYVEKEDLYRHSKWLAFMERRLLLSKELLNPENSCLIVTIDEKEYLRLGLLLEQIFPDGFIQMISTVINRKGNPRRGEFSRCEEFIYFVRFGEAGVSPGSVDMLHEEVVSDPEKIRWKSLLRLASTGKTSGRFNMFYPLFFESKSLKFLRTGDPLPDGVNISTVTVPKGETVLWPISKDGSDGRWSLSKSKFDDYIKKGYIKFGGKNGGGRTPYYLMDGQIKSIKDGSLVITGRDADGAVELRKEADRKQPMTIWNRPSHSTSGHGTTLLRDLLPDRKFPYPKSLYAVEDALRFFVADNPNAIVLDYFSGSGTTAHAVMRLNKQDNGCRQSILITNNEVSPEEQKTFQKSGLRPGDADWEKWGICNYITKPRVESAITGKTPDGKIVKGNYKFIDEFPMADGFNENAEFFNLTYESPISISHNLAFKRIAPLLWMRAGSQGIRVEDVPKTGYEIVENYGVLIDLDVSKDFCEDAAKNKTMKYAFIFTDDEKRFQSVVKRLPSFMEPVRLCEAYLKNFQFMSGE